MNRAMNNLLRCKNLIYVLLISASIGTVAFRSQSDAPHVQRSTIDAPIEAVNAQSEGESALEYMESLDGVTTDSGLKIVMVDEGTGASPQPGQFVKVAYTAQLADGTVFNRANGTAPYIFQLGEGQVIPAWEEALSMLNEGGRAFVLSPPELAYGDEGAPGVEPNETLIFDIVLLTVFDGSPAVLTLANENDFSETDSGLRIYDVESGDGDSPGTDFMASVHFTAWLEDGTKIDSSLDRDLPYTFTFDQNLMIPGWEEGIRSMQVGGTRQLVIPSELAYGDEGIENVIPGGTPLIFDVELLAILRPSPDFPLPIGASEFTETDTGLRFFDFALGDGATPEAGNVVSIHYTGWLADGTKFGSSLDSGTPFTFALGQGQAIAGMEEGMQEMQVGGQRQLTVPASLAYGASGFGDLIPPDETLTFEIELVAVQ